MASPASKLKLPIRPVEEETKVNPALLALFNAPQPVLKKKSPPPPPPSPRVPPADDANKKRKRTDDKQSAEDKGGKKDVESKKNNINKKQKEPEVAEEEKEEVGENGSAKTGEKRKNKKKNQKNKKNKKSKTQEDGQVNKDEEESSKNEEEDNNEADEKDDEAEEVDAKADEVEESEDEEGGEMDDEKKKECTVFVGNVPLNLTKKELRRIFTKYGKIHSIRFRSVAFAHPKRRKDDKKAAFLGKHFHPDRDTCNAYVVFAEKDSAISALAANNTKIEFNDDGVAHLSVDLAYAPTWNMARAAFVGNLPFSINDEELRSHFESAGTVKRVRIVRDPTTFMGKGFGFVEFENKDDLLGALALHESELQNRKIRVFKASNHQQQSSAKGNGKTGGNVRPYQGVQAVQGAALRVQNKRKRMEAGGKPKPKSKGSSKMTGGRPKKARTA